MTVHEAGPSFLVGTSTVQDCQRCGVNLISHGSVTWPVGAAIVKDGLTTRQIAAVPNCDPLGRTVRITERVGDQLVEA